MQYHLVYTSGQGRTVGDRIARHMFCVGWRISTDDCTPTSECVPCIPLMACCLNTSALRCTAPHFQVFKVSQEQSQSLCPHASGGELQRFAIAVVAAQNADIYMIDEPSSFLDVRQRLKAAQVCICVRARAHVGACPTHICRLVLAPVCL